MVIAERDCAAQAWHVDGAHLSPAEHLSPHVLNIFVPLVDVTLGGGTEIKPGSHFLTRNLAKQMLLARIKKTLRPPVVPLVTPGDALFDTTASCTRHAEQHGRRAARLRADGREAVVPGPRELSEAGAVRRGGARAAVPVTARARRRGGRRVFFLCVASAAWHHAAIDARGNPTHFA